MSKSNLKINIQNNHLFIDFGDNKTQSIPLEKLIICKWVSNVILKQLMIYFINENGMTDYHSFNHNYHTFEFGNDFEQLMQQNENFICATANDFADRKFYINLTYVNQVETILFCNGEYVKTLNSIAFSKDNSIVEKKVLKNQLCIGLTMLYCIDANVSEQSFLDALTQNSTQKAKDILDFLLENKRLQ